MPTPSLASNAPKPVLVKISGAIDGDRCIVYNRSTGEKFTVEIADGEASFDASNFTNGWTPSDVLEFRVNGTKRGSGTVTLTAAGKSPQTLTITLSSESATLPKISI